MKLTTIIVIAALLLTLSPVSAAGFVRGDTTFQAQVNAALALVRNSDPTDYATTIRYISWIEQNHQPDKWSYIYGYDGYCKVLLTLDSPIADATWQIASDLVHEGALCRDYFTGNVSDVRADEVHALIVQHQFLITAHGPQYQIDYMSQLIAQNAPYFK